jgi:predicted transcriptional regulator of viral defense system
MNKMFTCKHMTAALEYERNVYLQAGLMPGGAYTRITEIAADHHGYVTQQDARLAGIGAATLARMSQRGTLERTSQGVYRVPLIPPGPLDQYMEATLWPRGAHGVLSHQTALELHGLSDVNPAKIHLTVPRAHRIQRAVPDLYVIHRADLDAADMTAHKGIAIVTPARAVRECHAAGLGPALLEQAIEDGRRRGLFTARQAARLRRETGLERAA